MNSQKTAMDERRHYYQQFHHTLIGWYLTVTGLFFAGLVASDAKDLKGNLFAACVIFALILSTAISFLVIVARFAARIDNLHKFAKDSAARPEWEEEHKSGYYQGPIFVYHKASSNGVGSKFFLALMLILSTGNLLLAVARLA